MSYYGRNHLQDDWEKLDEDDYMERLEKAEEEASLFFKLGTVRQQAIYDRAMADLRGLSGPRYDRERKKANDIWADTTKEAAALLDKTIECIMQNGEISEEINIAWDVLRNSPNVIGEK